MSPVADWIAAHRVGFGAAPFMAYSEGGGEWSDWASDAAAITRNIPGGDLSVTQFMGLGPERVTYRLALGSGDDFAALKLLIGTRATLTLHDGVATTSGTGVIHAGEVYLEIPNVLLVSIDPGSVTRRIGGYITCDAEFRR